MFDSINLRSGYHGSLYKPKKIIAQTKKHLVEGETIVWQTTADLDPVTYIPPLEFDTIVGTGLSGHLMLLDMAAALKCNWLAVRKDKQGSHSHLKAEGTLGKRWIFLDDFIGNGSTFRYVFREVDKAAKHYCFETEFIGAYLYATTPHIVSAENLRERTNFPGFLT